MNNSKNGQLVSIKRSEGIGNLFLLLPILDKINSDGICVELVTKSIYIEAFQAIRPNFKYSTISQNYTVDLDKLTKNTTPNCHRTFEFGKLLKVKGPFPPSELSIPDCWKTPFNHLKGSIGFAPEARHPAREWPASFIRELATLIPSKHIVIIGEKNDQSLDVAFDYRGKLNIPQLLGLISNLDVVICLDSGILHIAKALNIPCITIFGGINPDFRILENDRVIVLQSTISCCPCNKIETCNAEYYCLRDIKPSHVLAALPKAKELSQRHKIAIASQFDF